MPYWHRLSQPRISQQYRHFQQQNQRALWSRQRPKYPDQFFLHLSARRCQILSYGAAHRPSRKPCLQRLEPRPLGLQQVPCPQQSGCPKIHQNAPFASRSRNVPQYPMERRLSCQPIHRRSFCRFPNRMRPRSCHCPHKTRPHQQSASPGQQMLQLRKEAHLETPKYQYHRRP